MTTFLNRLSNSDGQRVRIAEDSAGPYTFHDGLAYDNTDPAEMDRLVVSYAEVAEFYMAGIGFTETGIMLVFDASAGLPADTVWQSGLPISRAENRLCVDPTNDVAYVHQGVPFTTVGAVAVDGESPDPCPTPGVILTQAFDSTGAGYPSQLDAGGGSTVKAFSPFTFVEGAMITDLHWTGVKPTPAEVFPITAWLIEVWSDAAGEPDAVLQTMVFSPALANETSIGSFGGQPCYTYSVDFDPWFLADAGTDYWVSVQPVLNPASSNTWYWATAGAGSSGIVFDTIWVPAASNLAMDITGCIGEAPVSNFYQQEGNTDVYIQETADSYIQE